MNRLIEVKSTRDRKVFTEFPNKIFKNVHAYVPAFSPDEHAVFDKKKNPAFEYCEVIRYILINENGKVVGRIAGLINHKLNEAEKSKTARFTRLDMIDDIKVTKQLMDAVIAWAKSKGMTSIIGPMGFSDLDRMGLLTEGFDEQNMFITIWNAPYYKVHLESLGFIKDANWVERKIYWPKEMPEKVERVSSMVKQRFGYKLIKLQKKNEIDTYAYKAFELYNRAFMELYGFFPLTKSMMTYYIKQVKSIVRLEYLWFVKDKEDNIVGFGLIMPSLSVANKKSNGKLFPFGWLRMLKALKKHTVVDFYFIAVDEAHQSRGVMALIMEDAIKIGIKNGIDFAETGPELEDNIKINQQWQNYNHVIHRKRSSYRKEI